MKFNIYTDDLALDTSEWVRRASSLPLALADTSHD